MSEKPLSFEEILKLVKNLSSEEKEKLNKATSSKDDKIRHIVSLDMEQRVAKILKGKFCCPKCGSLLITKKGLLANGLQRFKCKDCGFRFNYFTGTLLEKNYYHWDLWIDVIHMMLMNIPLKTMKENLINSYHCDGIHIETVFSWKHKIMDTAKYVKIPELEGIIEIDETYIHEGQKGSRHRHLVEPFDPTQTRKPRKRGSPAQYGPLGPEFGNVICACDRNGHVFAQVIGTGACSEELFESLFLPHFKNITWLCTDANRIYSQFAEKYTLNHYVRPSNYLDNLNAGLKVGKTEQQLYNEEQLDYLDLYGPNYFPYTKFNTIKKENKLSLSHVNAFHNILQSNIVKFTHGTSLVHLDSYIAWQCLLVNFKADYGHTPTTRKDAEKIFEMLIMTRHNIKKKNIMSKTPDFSNSKKRYVNKLKNVTDNVREASEEEVCTYSLTSEDAGPSFNLRKFLESLPLYGVKELANYCKIPGRTKVKKGHTYKILRALEVHKDIDKAIIQYRLNHPTKQK